MAEDNKKAEILVSLKADVAAGVADVKREISSIPVFTEQATGKANKSLANLGQGGAKPLDDTTAATQRAVRQIERLNLELESGGRNTAAYLVARAKLAGADVDALAPLIAQNEKLRAAQALANAEFVKSGRVLDQYGNTAKGTAAALRQVPAQFTDIVVSLQGGQAPLTVLLQQGGQLKDIFGGVGNATRALGGYILGLVNPFTLTAAAVGAFGFAAYKASEDARVLTQALILTGTQGITSVSKLNAVAEGLRGLGVSSSKSSESLAAFITAGAKVDDRLQSITKNAIDLERLGGASVEETAKKFVALAKDPLADFDRLTLATYKQIEALLEQGNRTEAVTVAQAAFNEANKETAKSLAASLGPLDVATEAWKRYAVSVFDGIKASAAGIAGIFSPKTGDQERKDLQERRDRYAKLGYDTTEEDKRLEYFKRIDAAQQQGIENLTRETALKGLLADFDKNDEGAKKLRERNKLIADNTKLLEAGQISQKQYDDSLASYDKKHKDKAGPKPSDDYGRLTAEIAKTQIAAEQYLDTGTKLEESDKFRIETLTKIDEAFRKGNISLSQAVNLESEMYNAQQKRVDVEKALRAIKITQSEYAEQIALQNELNDAYVRDSKAREQISVAAYQVNQAVNDANGLMDVELRMMGSSARERAIAISQYQNELDLKRALAAIDKVQYDDGEVGREAARQEARAAAAKKGASEIRRIEIDNAKNLSDTLGSDLKSAFSAAFRDTSGEPLKAFGDAIANVIYTRAATALAESLIGAAGGTGTGSFLSSLFSFDGGGFTGSGARAGGLDGKGGFMAVVHPNETVVDHTKGQTSGGGSTIVNNNYFTVGDVASVSMVQKAIAGSERRIAGAMGRSMQYGGALA